MSNFHEFYLTGEIKSPENYTDWFDTIRHAGPSDVVKFYINSTGGDIFTAIQFMEVLRITSAHKIISVEGMCISAATLIFMSADEFQIAPHSIFMFHDYSGERSGKGGEMIDQMLHERKWSSNLLKKTYAGFLTDAEIKSILENRDIWLDADAVKKRITKAINAAAKP